MTGRTPEIRGKFPTQISQKVVAEKIGNGSEMGRKKDINWKFPTEIRLFHKNFARDSAKLKNKETARKFRKNRKLVGNR